MRYTFLAIFLLFTTYLLAQTTPSKYSRVKVWLHETHIIELAELGLEYDHGVMAKGRYWVNDISSEEMKLLEENDIEFEVLVDDVQAWYQAQNNLPSFPSANS
ncbi:MAG: hypothetical protein AAGJ18_17430, partial [Bacteroidota bacterium]